MAARSIWSGTLPLNAMFAVPISVFKATDDYEGKVHLNEVCEEHLQPFSYEIKCSVSGRPRLTKEKLSAGISDGESMVKAVYDSETDEYRELAEETLEEIGDALTRDTIEIVAVVDYDECPMEYASELYYIGVPGQGSDQKRGKQMLGVVADTLETYSKVIMAKWCFRGSEFIVALHGVGGVMEMNRIRYAQEIRQVPQRADLDVSAVGDSERDLTLKLLDTFTGDFDHDAMQDEAVELRKQAVDAVLDGKAPKPLPKGPAATTGGPDLMSALQASLDATKAKGGKAAGKKKAPAQKRGSKRGARAGAR